MIDIVWQAFQPEDPYSPINDKPWTYLAPDWAEAFDNTSGLIRDICEDYFDDEVWDSYFGLEHTDGAVLFEIQAPDKLKGTWLVQLTRATKASANRIDDPRA